MEENEEDGFVLEYKVVVNDAQQYSVWPSWRENPSGWSDAGFSGPEAECLAWVKAKWESLQRPG